MYIPKIFNLSNNLTVIIDNFNHVKTVSLGLFASIGSRVENYKNNGITHFLEHMLFKGTKNRSIYQISEELESKGGFLNAWTSKDKSAWYCKVIKEDTNLALDILFDMFNNSIFPEAELEKEKQVVIEEIKQSKDEPEDLIYDYFQNICYKNNSLGLPILGTEEIINNITKEDLNNHLKNYNNANMVFVAAGNIDEDKLLTKIEEVSFSKDEKETHLINAKHSSEKGVLIKDNLNQVHIIVSYPSANILSNEYYIYSIISAILGKGMSSRLFREIREKRGLVYSIYTFTNSYYDVGSLAIQAACSYNKANEVINLIQLEIKNLANNSISEEELLKAKRLLISSLYMGLENSYYRAEKWACNMLHYKSIISIKELTDKILSITKEDILNVSKKLNIHSPVVAVLSGKEISLQ